MYTTIYCLTKGGDKMPSCPSFHSKLPGTAVYHNNSACTEGNNIESCNRISGTGSHRLCSRCKELNSQGK